MFSLAKDYDKYLSRVTITGALSRLVADPVPP